MVIGIEGNVHVGKTTFIKNNFNEFNIIKEIPFNKKLNDYDRQLYYIENEIKKKEKLSNNTILDRTIISTILYTFYTNSLNVDEKKKIIEIIERKINEDKIILPSIIYLIIYPYKLISLNHLKLMKEKGTQDSLIDYSYYLNYSLFFSNCNYASKKIVRTKEYRQIMVYNSDIFKNITTPPRINTKILLDGAPAIGKSTIGNYQKKYQYIKEFKYKKYTLSDYQNQIDSIIERINILNKENILLDTSFLMGITHLFYNEQTSQELKLEMIDKIIGKVFLNNYITKIIYLVLDRDKLIERKNMDKFKERKHFFDNLNYLELEKNFYYILDKRLAKMSNINFLDATYSIEKLSGIIEDIPDKPLLLVDLFYEIKEAIKEGEL